LAFLTLLLAGCSETQSHPTIVDGSRTFSTPRHTTYTPDYTPDYKTKKTADYKPYTPGKTTPAYTGPKTLRGRTIIVDPGHGGKDPGAGEVGYSNVFEKHIVLDISMELARQLKARGARVIMTRIDDRFIPLENRAAIADKYNADLLISVHADSAPDSSVFGPTIYIADNPSYISRKVAGKINDSLYTNSLRPRGIRNAAFKVLVNHSRPSVLVECGYLTNRADANRLNSSWYKKKVAQAISNGVTNSLGSRNYYPAK
jgi:N-acetylmuramoyl-L-alanine amidase